jgi:hypothetical protein
MCWLRSRSPDLSPDLAQPHQAPGWTFHGKWLADRARQDWRRRTTRTRARWLAGRSELNPLSWAHPAPEDVSLQGFGHFLCLDRWGPPSQAEAAQGMPYHGEAAHVPWQVVREPGLRDGAIEAQISATLPKAGLSVRRTIRLSVKAAVCAVREEVRNDNPLGRIYNMVQHPTIAPPFLDETTLVDCNGSRGFAQGGSLPSPEEPSFFWPQALKAMADGRQSVGQ